MFGLLDMWDALGRAITRVEGVMGGPVCEAQMDDVAALQTSTQKEARATFAEFEASIGRELGRSGTVESTVRFSPFCHLRLRL
jgi:hypothetical protein